jgi:hypothetical protein
MGKMQGVKARRRPIPRKLSPVVKKVSVLSASTI